MRAVKVENFLLRLIYTFARSGRSIMWGVFTQGVAIGLWIC